MTQLLEKYAHVNKIYLKKCSLLDTGEAFDLDANKEYKFESLDIFCLFWDGSEYQFSLSERFVEALYKTKIKAVIKADYK